VRTILRIAFVLTFTAIAAIMNGCDLLLPWHPFTTLGITAGETGVVHTVDPIAAERGLHPGDVIDIKRLAPGERMDLGGNEGTSIPLGTTAEFALTSGRTVTVLSHNYARSFFLNVTDITCVIALWIAIGIAAFLVLMRPTPATWAFFIFSFWFCSGGVLIYGLLPIELRAAAFALRMMTSVTAAAAFFSFTLRFPNDVPTGWLKAFERATLFAVAPMLAFSVGANQIMFIFAGTTPLALPGLAWRCS